MKSKFDRAFEAVIGHEGGYVNNPNDRGGETKYGISKRSYPHLDIRNLTLAQAKEIYKNNYWDIVHGDELPYRVGFNLFDGAVNSGPAQSIAWAQKAVGVWHDGIIGPITMSALKKMKNTWRFSALYNAERQVFLCGLKDWDNFSEGWIRRTSKNLKI